LKSLRREAYVASGDALLVRRRKDDDAAGRRDGAAPVDSGATLSVALTGWLAQSLDYAMACWGRGR